MQILLLRVLQEKEFNPVGSDKVKRTNVRIISATNENMKKALEEGRFREDLYYRLAELEILQPPLKDCKDDILPLAEFSEKNIPIEYMLRMKALQKKRKHVCWGMTGLVMCGN